MFGCPVAFCMAKDDPESALKLLTFLILANRSCWAVFGTLIESKLSDLRDIKEWNESMLNEKEDFEWQCTDAYSRVNIDLLF